MLWTSFEDVAVETLINIFTHLNERINKTFSFSAVLTVGLSGCHVCEQQQAGVLGETAEKSQPAQQQLRQPLSEAAIVEAEVGGGHQVARRRVQADAAAPDVALRHAADGSTDGRQVVRYLEEQRNKEK